MQQTEKKFEINSKRKVKNDIIFVAVLLLIVLIAGVFMVLLRKNGDTVIVTVDGKAWGEYSLNEDITVNIKTGSNFNVLVIKDGKAYIESASCPDGICSSHRPIKRNGESIICLPNKVVVTVNTKDKSAPDVIA